jgi:hypothetical protein
MCSATLLLALLLVDPQAAILDFEQRLQQYVELHRTLEKDTPPQIVTPDPARILAAADALADAIVVARPNARQGDIFTPPIAKVFRERILLGFPGVGDERFLEELYESSDYRRLRAAVHARDPYHRFPRGLPPQLLAMLPELPDEVEYRVVGRDLALWDTHAEMIIDFIANAFPEETFV